MIRNPYYIGMTEIDGKLEPSKVYPAIVDPALYWKAQEVLKARQGVHVGVHENKNQQPHLLSGLLKCGCCGRNLQWGRKDGKGDTYARCIWKHDGEFSQFRMTETRWTEWAESFFCPLFRINSEPVANPKRALLLTQLDKIQTGIVRVKTKFAKGELDADLEDALQMAKEEREKVQKQLDALPPDQTSPTIPWAEMSFDQKREALLYIVERIMVYSDRVVVRFRSYVGQHDQGTVADPVPVDGKSSDRRPDQTFPLMRRRPKGYVGKPLNCLTPRTLTPSEARAVESFDCTGVNWRDYICDRRGEREAYKSVGQFHYANPHYAKAAPPIRLRKPAAVAVAA
jgi:hypothetical protein